MSRFYDMKSLLSKLLVPVAVLIFIIFSFSVTTFAETTSVEFTMEEEPVFIDEKSTDEILEFYENATRAELFSKETNTFVKRQIKLSENGYPVEKTAVVHTFRVTDLRSVDVDNVSDFVSEIVGDVFLELTTGLGMKYVSTLIYMYGATYEVSYDPETGEVTEMLLHIALFVGDGFDKVDTVIENYIRPTVETWKEYPPVKQIIELKNYILDGRFRYDVAGAQRKSTYQFVMNGKGVCEEYAGLTALFLDELGFENMLIRGYAESNGERVEHVWNLVNIEGKWYHLDILWNGPVDENGIHTDIAADYLLKSTKTVKSTHLTPSIYYSYTEKADEDYDLSEYIYKGDIVTPQMKLDMARENLAAAIDAAFDVCFRNSWKYTSESISRIMPVYTAAKAVYDNENATIEEIDAQTVTVNEAVEKYAVVFVEADKSKLYKSLSQAYECMLYDYALYTPETVKALNEPYEAAVLVYQDPYATQKEVDNARSNLKKYLNRLEKIVVEEPEDATVPDNTTTVPDNSGSTETPGNETTTTPEDTQAPPVVITPLPDEGVPEITPPAPDDTQSEIPDPEDNIEPDIPTEDETEEPEPPVEEEQPSDSDPVDAETTDPENTDTPAVEQPPIVEDPETDPENEPEENEEEKPVIVPTEPKSAISTDLIIYGVGALVALGGIIYLIVSKLRNNENDDDFEEIDESSLKSEIDDEESTVENTEEAVAAAVSVEEKSEEKSENASEETVEENKEVSKENADKSEESSDNKAEPETEKSAEEDKTETVENAEEKEVSEGNEKEAEPSAVENSEEKEPIVVPVVIGDKTEEQTEEKSEETEKEELPEKDTEESSKEEISEEKVEEEITESSEDNSEKEETSESVCEDSSEKESTPETSSEEAKPEEETAETSAEENSDEEKTEAPEKTEETSEDKISESEKTEETEKESSPAPEQLSETEQRNQRKISRLMNYFKSRKE